MTNENILLVVVLLAAAALDYKIRKVPNIITFPAILYGISLGLFHGAYIGLTSSFLGLLLGIALLSIPYAMGGIGAGDLKLLGAIGALKGPVFVFESFLGAAIIGGLMAVGRMAFIIKGPDTMILRDSIKSVYYSGALSVIELPENALKGSIPYAVAISGGAVAALLLELH